MSGRRRPSATIRDEKQQNNSLEQFSPSSRTDEKKAEKTYHLRRKRTQDDGWGGTGWEGYMHSKVLKLDKQFDDQVICPAENRSEIFKDVVIFVNGYTSPSVDELRKLMKENGGGFQQYYSASLCTHIIATNLPDSKIKDIKNKKVVHPDWILDSINAKTKLPLYKYLLYGGEKDSLPKLTFCKKSSEHESKADNEPKPGPSKHGHEVDDSSSSFSYNESDAETMTMQAKVRKESLPLNNDPALQDIPWDEFYNEPFEEMEVVQDGTTITTDASHENVQCGGEVDTSLLKGGPSLSKHDYSVSPRKGHGKAGDSNFISDFYSNSRLHHLSMWRSELKRFAKMIHQTGKKTKGKQGLDKGRKDRIMMHIDLDSFFVSVALKEQPQLRGMPVAVCHAGRGGTDKTSSATFGSMSEIASCSYEARKHGVKNGMFLGRARQLCPELQCVPYYFENYRAVSQRFYEILASYTNEIEAVSCDEALLDITNLVTAKVSVLELASKIRAEIEEKTGCTASAGIGPSILIARMATRTAKPNGQTHLKQGEIQEFIVSQKVQDLPGVGWSLGRKLDNLNIVTCGDLQKLALSYMQKEFGQKNGLSLYNFCRGDDNRTLRTEQERKSVSAEINYGIRFVKELEVENFIKELAEEVQRRLNEIETKGSNITLKLMVKKDDAPNPAKFMGHGICDSISRSVTITSPTSDADIVAKECIHLVKQLKIPPQNFRGMGIQVSKLVSSASVDTSKGGGTLDRFMKGVVEKEHGRTNSNSRFSHVTTSMHEIDDFADIIQKGKVDTLSYSLIDPSSDSLQASNYTAENPTNTECMGVDVAENTLQVKAEQPRLPLPRLRQDPTTLSSFADEVQDNSSKIASLHRIHNKVHATKETLKKKSPRKSPSKRSPNKKSPLKKPSTAVHGNIKMTDFVTRVKLKMGTNTETPAPPDPPLPFLPNSPVDSGLRGSSHAPLRAEIDMNVLNELPDDLRKAVMKEYKLEESCLPKIDVSPEKKGDTRFPVSVSQLKSSSVAVNENYGEPSTPVTREDDSKAKDGQSREQQYSLPGFYSPSQLDQSVLKALPETIRKEIEDAIRERSISKNVPKEKKRNMHAQRNENQPNHSSSAIKKNNDAKSDLPMFHPTAIDILSPSQLDTSVMEQLPLEIKAEIELVMNKRKGRREQSKNDNICRSDELGNPREGHKIVNCESTKTVMAQDQSLLSPSQIDPAVMDALPWELQQEVHLGLRRKALQKYRERERRELDNVEKQILDKKIEENVRREETHHGCLSVMPTLCGVSEYHDIKRLVKQWVKSTEEPLQEDADCLTSYLQDLVGNSNLESSYHLLLCLKRLISTSSENWRKTFNCLLLNIQNTIESAYGSRLSVDLFDLH